MIIGIYKITSPSGRIYIGQSRNIYQRFQTYKNINESKKQIRLNRSFIKYGIENHIFEIIEKCNFEQLNERERYYQDYYDVLNTGLNCYLTNTEELPKICSDEIKSKISKSRLGMKFSKSHIENLKHSHKGKAPKTTKRFCRKIVQLDVDDNIIKIWSSIKEASIFYNINQSSISHCCAGRKKLIKGFKWIYLESLN